MSCSSTPLPFNAYVFLKSDLFTVSSHLRLKSLKKECPVHRYTFAVYSELLTAVFFYLHNPFFFFFTLLPLDFQMRCVMKKLKQDPIRLNPLCDGTFL